MPKFAIFYVPEANEDLYRLGAQMVRYDVRARNTVALSARLRDQLAFDEEWVALARPYGFHLTVGDAIDCTEAAIPLVERELEALLLCFDPAHPLTLRQCRPSPVVVWGETGQETIVLRYDPNDALLMLHALIVARINPLGVGSGYLRRYLEQSDELASPSRTQRTRLFYSPFVLDEWAPHFTLLNPYTGDDRDHLAPALSHLFEGFPHIEIRSLCLMAQMHSEDRWHIYREVKRGEVAGY